MDLYRMSRKVHIYRSLQQMSVTSELGAFQHFRTLVAA